VFVQGGADVNAANRYGATPLHNACLRGHIFEVLITYEIRKIGDLFPSDVNALATGTGQYARLVA
jgi:ankyrin repeat protein